MKVRAGILVILLPLLGSGCAAIPEVRHKPEYHNPFPQLRSVAILPFYNLSTEPTVDQDAVALAYFGELQKIPGFEVMPPGVVKQFLAARNIQIDGSTDFQKLARELGVDVLIRGAVTDYSPYYPPRLGLAVDWFAANPSFYPIPPGYGLPWGTPAEKHIPDPIVFQAEFALARAQLETQTPEIPQSPDTSVRPSQNEQPLESLPLPSGDRLNADSLGKGAPEQPDLPPDWPDPRGFIPPPPSPQRPPYRPQSKPIISLTRIYNGNDEQLTQRLEQYYYFQDDARYGGWQGYLARSEDFIRFCCYLNITEILAARGGEDKTRVALRWLFGRYDVGSPKR